MYEVKFFDSNLGEQVERFESYVEAQEYWQEYADADTCLAGKMTDLENNEVIWDFDDREAN